MGSWRDAARRALVGEKVDLKTTNGELWIRPKKLSQAATDAIKDIRAKPVTGAGSKEMMRRAMKIREKYKDDIDLAALDKMPEDDRLEIIDLYSAMRAGPQAEVYRIMLAHGIGEHNFADDAGKLVGGGQTLDPKTVDEVLEWGDLAVEIVAAIEAYNRPLAQATGGTSQTQPSGSTPAPSSEQAPESSPMVATP